MKVVFLDSSALPPGNTLPALRFDHQLKVFEATRADQTEERIADADIVITCKVRLDRKILAGTHRLKFVAIAATGADAVDLEACSEMGVTVSNVRDYATHSVPEHTFALMLALRRSLMEYDHALRNGRWQEAGTFCLFDFPIRDLHGTSLGVIGDGALGRAVAGIGRAFGMEVRFAAHDGPLDSSLDYLPLNTILSESDVITVHCPLLASTRNLIGQEQFQLMRRKPILLNTARGGIVDEHALLDALKSGQIAGAGFDVMTQEPPGDGHPFNELIKLPNFVVTPHVAWSSAQAIEAFVNTIANNIEAFVRGEPRYVVTC
ncbi:glycerate dehydrogenase [Paraburkholderia ginsengiterrae]|uniref:Glycerate dehydrogenase n=1 Tax=Paraburkholderia ginsengiterrae TaxID=1462993 RepID=A0A1A9N342_9BURK|nr:D-2-hydroxyacid dehydrogenase [Paraburkholderia ginsengiterrae]OAJ56002.1 glycerate dehydrogenase [Paraburkholderia ginsengiterrae]OAJ58542.1 glycerate dehydrogenase [Paraburkholderia ginsengiterrae]